MKTIKILALLALLAAPLAACAAVPGIPTIYEIKPIQATVVDADTGQPIEGAVILAKWTMWPLGPRDVNDSYTAKVMETTTDSLGRFVIPGWGPQPICCGFMTWEDPLIFVFKPGYKGVVETDYPSVVVDDPRVRDHYWNGEKFKLQPFKGNYEGEQGQKDFENFDYFFIDSSRYGFLMEKEKPCEWSEVPKFMGAIAGQLHVFEQHGYHDRNSIIKYLLTYDDYIVHRDHCESPKEYFGKLSNE